MTKKTREKIASQTFDFSLTHFDALAIRSESGVDLRVDQSIKINVLVDQIYVQWTKTSAEVRRDREMNEIALLRPNKQWKLVVYISYHMINQDFTQIYLSGKTDSSEEKSLIRFQLYNLSHSSLSRHKFHLINHARWTASSLTDDWWK